MTDKHVFGEAQVKGVYQLIREHKRSRSFGTLDKYAQLSGVGVRKSERISNSNIF